MDLTDSNLRDLLVELLEKDEFPIEDGFQLRHIKRIEAFSIVGEDNARFTVERHPHLFGRESLGGPSAAYIPTVCTYEIDTAKKEVSLIKKKEYEPVVNYEAVASETVGEYWDYGDTLVEQNQFRKMSEKEEVLKYAEDRFKELDFSLEAYDLPESFYKEYYPVLEKEFINEMVSQWKICSELDEEERQEAISEKRKNIHAVKK
jgi:hypothetical protein